MEGISSHNNSVVIEAFNGDQAIADRVADLHLEVRLQQQLDDQNIFGDGLYGSQTDLRNMQTYYVDPGGNFFIAYQTETQEIAGFVGLRRNPDDETGLQLKRMAVLKPHRRQGIGSKMGRTALAWAAAAGFKTVNLSTGQKEVARPMYESFGFVVIGEDKVNDDWLMRLDLTGS